MESRKIGPLDVTLLGLGCADFGWLTSEQDARAIVDACFDAGINNFDTAESYGSGKSEEFLGRALGRRRDQVVISTKVSGFGAPKGVTAGDPAWIARAVEGSLRRLGTDYIDLYLLHIPDPSIPIGETLAAFGELVEAGKVRAVGCSNFAAEMLEGASAVASERGVPAFVSAQNNYSLLDRSPEPELVPACERLGVALTPYFPLASGVLTGKYKRGQPLPEGSRLALWGEHGAAFRTDDRLRVVERLEAYAMAHGHTLLELALSWLVDAPAVANVIVGARSVEQLNANAAAVTAWTLTTTERADVNDLAPVAF